MALILIFKIIVSQTTVNKEKMNIIMICVRAQLFTNNHRLLWNSPSWRQFKIRSADFTSGTLFLLFIQQPLFSNKVGHFPVHYFFCLFNNLYFQIKSAILNGNYCEIENVTLDLTDPENVHLVL